jgi:hypothetical protein
MFRNTRLNMMLVVLSSILFSCGTPEVSSSPTSEIDRTMKVYLRAKSPNVDWVSDGDFTYHIHYWGNGSASNWNSLPELPLSAREFILIHSNHQNLTIMLQRRCCS